jgi:hypothetical protein
MALRRRTGFVESGFAGLWWRAIGSVLGPFARGRWGSPHISGDLAACLDEERIDHVRGAPYHTQTQATTKPWHQSRKNRALLQNHYLPGALEEAIGPLLPNRLYG